MMNVLILTGKFGMGHYSASYSLQQQIKEKFPTAHITIIDFFRYTLPKTSRLLYESFDFMINRASFFYNWYYKFSDEHQLDTMPLLKEHFLKSLTNLIEDLKPVCVISTLPFCSQLMSAYKKKLNCNLPFITCLTDISTHSEWIHPATDYYLVATPTIANTLIKKGVDPVQIEVVGIPVKPEFKKTSDERPLSDPSLEKKILIMGGGLGLLPKNPNFYQSLNELPHVKTTVIVGKNKRLFQLLHHKYENIEVIGFTDEVYKYMQQADLMISKPGGITLFEAIHSELPILVIEPFLQQEINNAHFIDYHQVGKILTRKSFKNCYNIQHMIYDDSALAQMRLNMKQLKKQINLDALERLIASFRVQELGEYVS